MLRRFIGALAAMLLLSGCGLYVPKPHEFYEARSNDTEFKNVIINNIKCELHRGIQNTLDDFNNPENPRVNWIKKWGAKVNLKFTTEEMGTIGPNLSWTPPSPFSLFFGLDASTHATRTEDLTFTYAFSDLLGEGPIPKDRCAHENGILIQSDLDIPNFVEKNVYLLTIPGTLPPNKNVLFSDWQYAITFVASYSANVTPAWTFKRIAVNSSGKLFDVSRTKTSNLTVTFAEIESNATPDKPAELSVEGRIAADAARIGQAAAAANRSLVP